LAELPFTPSDRSVAAYSIISTPAKEVTNPHADPIKAAREALEAKQFALAVTLFESAVMTDATALNGISAELSAALFGMAEELLATDPPAAKSALLKVLEIQPDSVTAMSKLGYLYVQENKYPEAIESYRKVAELEPHQPSSYFNLGYIYAITEDYQQAKEMYSKVVNMEPDFMDEALVNLAIVQQELGERNQCVQNLKRAIKINPANTSAADLLAQITEDKE
jgi:tetratricopeptide (TPR) repeat protein